MAKIMFLIVFLGLPGLLFSKLVELVPAGDPAYLLICAVALAENLILLVTLGLYLMKRSVKEVSKKRNQVAARKALGLYGKAILEA